MGQAYGTCVYQHSSEGAHAWCSWGLDDKQQTWCCTDFRKPVNKGYIRSIIGANAICSRMCDIDDFVNHKEWNPVDTGTTGGAWSSDTCSTDKDCQKKAGITASMTPYSDWYDWHQMNDTMLIQFLLATLILFCVANLFVFIRRKLRRGPRYTALNKVADSDTDTESILINN